MTLGAVRAHREGVVTACSIVANGRDFAHAVSLVRELPELDVGVHFTLVGERPLSPPDSVRSLVKADGGFVGGYKAFAARYFGGRLRLDDVERELRAQAQRVVAAGLRPVHANGHQHLHVLPGIFDVVLRLAGEFGLRFIRIPSEPAPLPLSVRAVALRGLNSLAGRARARLRSVPDLRASDRTLGVRDAGHLRWDRLALRLPELSGVVELVAHPGVGDDAIARDYGWGFEWDAETANLCDPRLRAAIGEAGIRLLRIRDLA